MSSVLAFFFDPGDIRGFTRFSDYPDSYFILYGIFACYCLSPLYTIRNPKYKPELKHVNFNINQRRLLMFGVLGGIYAIIYVFPHAFKSVALGASEIRNSFLKDKTNTVLPISIFTTIAVAFASFFSVFLAVFFMSLKSNLSKTWRYLLFIASLSYIVVSLAYTARDGFLFYIIFGSIFVTNYWSYFNDRLKKRIKIFGFSVLAIGVFVLGSFTQDRFGDSDAGTMGYIATQPYVFAENIIQREGYGDQYYYGTSLRLPLINRVLGIPIEEFDRTEPYEWTFGTFLTDFYNVNGFLSLIILSVLFTEYFRYQFKKSKNSSLRYLLVYTFYVHFIVSGLFYFRLGSFSGNVFMLILVIFISLQKKNSIQ
ncbi:O-antigen polymerase [Dokdonia pacifica]|nr:O-antigen polymerase [Dokdonia pacifica]